jgi:hypothetical protein
LFSGSLGGRLIFIISLWDWNLFRGIVSCRFGLFNGTFWNIPPSDRLRTHAHPFCRLISSISSLLHKLLSPPVRALQLLLPERVPGHRDFDAFSASRTVSKSRLALIADLKCATLGAIVGVSKNAGYKHE